MIQRTATCFCKALKVVVQGEPIRISICHCLDCQVRSGAAFAHQARFETRNVRIFGDSNVFIRTEEDPAENAHFYFCPKCGSGLYYQIANSPDVTAIAVGAFADPCFPQPHYSVFEERKHSWIALPDSGMEHYE